MVTQGGAYIFQLVDFYGASGIPILWCCFFQVMWYNPVQGVCEDDFLQTIAIGWVYGVSKFASNVEQMTGMLPNRYWRVTWAGVAPAVMGVIFLFYCVRVGVPSFWIVPSSTLWFLIQWEPVKYGTVEYPLWAHVVGFIISASSMMWIPGYALYYLYKTQGSFKEVTIYLCSITSIPSHSFSIWILLYRSCWRGWLLI